MPHTEVFEFGLSEKSRLEWVVQTHCPLAPEILP